MRRPLWVLLIVGLAWLAVEAYDRYLVAAVDVTSEPAGAEVRIDGRRVGITPFSSESLPSGLHRIEVSHSHFAIWERQLQLDGGGRTTVHAVLERGPGELTLLSNPRGAWVEVDGERVPGKTPLTITLISGYYDIAMGMAERRSTAEQVLVNAGDRRELRLDLDMDPHGSLVITTVPADARVRLPGAEVDYSPGVRLPMGEHRVQVSRAGYRTADLRLAVGYGDNQHRVTLERAFAALRVITDPADAQVVLAYSDDPGGRIRRRDYRPGEAVPVGPVEVRATAMGRRSAYRRLTLEPGGATVRLTLEPLEVTPGRRFRDDLTAGGQGPALVVLPAGSFVMGSGDGPPSERPPREVRLTQPFAVSVYEVTVADYAAFATAAGIDMPPELADSPPDLPMRHVTFEQAAAYADWLTAQTSHRYRLPTEAEWEYLARAGSPSEYFFGDDAAALCAYGNVGDRSLKRRYRSYGAAECDDGFVELAPVGSFPANDFGVQDVIGNVAEWVRECGLPGYAGAPNDGSPLDDHPGCSTRGVRGGSWDAGAAAARSAKRNIAASASGDRGIRLVREL
ncbi:MAG: SUMF1/EgtB/PvdO family nonheme iron enzyme [Gammaproteobacteria bacterium]|jgi:formylglycine-generating enzyme required for sulfatase activity|nr:SUMF1/EgtB/PvdO family nonheme iron enzyme [Gammaproteobacteria bacterium]